MPDPSSTYPGGSWLNATARQISQVVQNTTTETAWNFPDVVIPGNVMAPGWAIRVSQAGVYQSGLSQSITPFIRMGPAATALTSRTTLATTPNPVSGLLNAAADTPWAAETLHVVQTDGSIMSAGRLFFSTSATAALNALVAQRTSISGVDLTVDNVVSASAKWATAMSANLIVCTLFLVEVIPKR